MGTVNFNTTVNKNVDLNKQVDLNVDKDVLSAVDIRGNLATAEASADAVGTGGGGGGGGEEVIVEFTIIDFTDTDLVTANAVANPPGNPSSSATGIILPALGAVQQTLFAQVLSAEGQGDLGVNNPLLGKLAFDQGNNTASNAYADYEFAPVDIFPDASNADIIADYNEKLAAYVAEFGAPPDTAEERQAFVDTLCYTLRFGDIDFDPGNDAADDPATVRVSLLFGDEDGDQSLATVAFVPGDNGEGFSDLDLTFGVAGIINPAASVAPGTVLAGDANGARIVAVGVLTDINPEGDGVVNFDELTNFQILLEDQPETDIGGNNFSSLDFFALITAADGLGFVENPSEDGTDASVGEFTATRCEFEEEFGLLAETDTFAQVQPGGAFSFSESLAASTPVVVDAFDFA